MPLKIGNLPRLETLSVPSCSLTGHIPSSIFNMSSLKVIDLTNNSLSGILPMDIRSWHLPVIETLHLSYNQLTGKISSCIWECRGLRSLSLSDNNFTGSIPTTVGNLTLLRHFDLAGNKLTGALPGEIGNLNLEVLSLSDNTLTGHVPNRIFNASNMVFLGLANNHFSGQLPSLWLPNLERLFLGGNRFSGVIPSSVSNSSKLTILHLSGNSFTGPIPNTLGNMRDLRGLYLGENNFTRESSTPELRFLSSLTNCRQLSHLGIALNQFNGFLPTSIGNLSTSLQDFEAFGSNIKGSIPSEIGNLSGLIFISIDSNELTGFIPPTLGKLQQLERLYLEHNRLEGSIPDSLCQLRNLGDIFVSDNRLYGHIPACLGELKSMRNLYLDSNNLTSTIPLALWSLEDLLSLNLSTNYLSGSLPSDIQKLRVITKLDLSHNQLSGDIPSTIGSFQMLASLSLAYNKLEGPISQSMGNLLSLESLDLSNNNLTGVIPKSLEALRYLQFFDASYNRLEGEIPTGGQFANFTAQSFMQNRALCGAPRLQVPVCKSETLQRSRSRNMILKYTLPPILSAISLLALISLLIKYRNRSMRSQSVRDNLHVDWRRVSYNELLEATDGFKESNLLGKGSVGSVYKGTFSDGKVVAVKVFSLQLEGAYKSFDVECEVMRNIRHRNLTKIINSCCNSEFRALVLEYMPSGTLENWLYTDFFHLSLLQRLNIMIDVAAALEYLHHGYTTPIVHCDLKPSNVLLDEDMVGHVSDFGISKLFGEDQFIALTKALGTIGYMAPEFGTSGIVSTRGDVYSYGVMLMEMLTRKKPTDEMFTGDLTLKQWVNKALPGSLNEVVDTNLIHDNKDFFLQEQCMSSILHLAVECSNDSPEWRINMNQVLSRLQKIKVAFLANKKS